MKEFQLDLKHYHKSSGFTLIEILIVVIVIGILAGALVGLMNFSGVHAKMRDTARVSDLRSIQNALEQYFVDYRRYPILLSWGNPPATLSPKYIKIIPSDPLGVGYQYYYRTDAFGAVYALVATMEISTSNDGHECSALNAAYFTTTFPTADDFCYGVESPTIVR